MYFIFLHFIIYQSVGMTFISSYVVGAVNNKYLPNINSLKILLQTQNARNFLLLKCDWSSLGPHVLTFTVKTTEFYIVSQWALWFEAIHLIPQWVINTVLFSPFSILSLHGLNVIETKWSLKTMIVSIF